MSELNKKRVENLLSQDEVVNSFQFKEFRMNLENSISELERKEQFYLKASKYTGLGYILAVVLLVLLMLAGQMVNTTQYGMYVFWAVAIPGNILLLAAIFFSSVHWIKYRPVLRKAKEDLQLSVMADIQQQVTELARRIDEQ